MESKQLPDFVKVMLISSPLDSELSKKKNLGQSAATSGLLRLQLTNQDFFLSSHEVFKFIVLNLQKKLCFCFQSFFRCSYRNASILLYTRLAYPKLHNPCA